MSSLSLNGEWQIRAIDGQHGSIDQYISVECDPRYLFPAEVPGEVHNDMMRAGLINDPNIGINTLSARWVEEQIWIYRKSFTAPKEALTGRSFLVFDRLDLIAGIYLNGKLVGRHTNSFYPCRVEVTDFLVEGSNLLAVTLDPGLYAVSEKNGNGYSPALDHQLHKRSWLRKPQHQFSWDWHPRLLNCGITKGVTLEYGMSARIDSISLTPKIIESHKTAALIAEVRIDNLAVQPSELTLTMSCSSLKSEQTQSCAPGISSITVELPIVEPHLWWPRGYGEQPLYDVEFALSSGSHTVDTASRRTAIRSVELDQSAHPAEGEYFIVKVNGVRIFLKGGNWVPPDMIFANINADKYRRLVELATEANFNALRIWGGGLYAEDDFLDACDELGVVVWHDFIFACSQYPADDQTWLQDVQKEVDYITRQLSHHPSLCVWCGNNELEWGFWDWGFPGMKVHPDHSLYHIHIPRILKQNDPSRPYWPSSPYSTDYRHPQMRTTGDQHPWGVSLQVDEANFHAYRDYADRFPNEGGVLGCSNLVTLKQFLPQDQQYIGSPSWEHHDNAANYWRRPLSEELLKHWLGKDSSAFSLEEYAYANAMLQAEGLSEYIVNYRRRKWDSSCAIFWMYNDSWPTTHGWTIVDYYERRKPAFYAVKRAFAGISVVCVREGRHIRIYGVNDTQQGFNGQLWCGMFGLDGSMPGDNKLDVHIPANRSVELAEMPTLMLREQGFNRTGIFAQLWDDEKEIAQHRLFLEPFKELCFSEPRIKVDWMDGCAIFLSDCFVWGVCIDETGEEPLPDNYFDLLPHMEYKIPWPESKPLPTILRTGNQICE